MLEKKKHSLSYFQHMYTPNVLLLLVLYNTSDEIQFTEQLRWPSLHPKDSV